MSIHPAFTIPVGSLRFEVPAGRRTVPGLLWGNLAVATLLESHGYEAEARQTLEKLQEWLKTPLTDLAWPGEQTKRVGRRLTDGLQPGDGDLSWYVARSATRQEAKAEQGLVEAGLVVYAPKMTRWRRSARKKVKITQALLPGYIFVGCRSKVHDQRGHDEDLNAIAATEFVHAIVRFTADRAALTVPFFGPAGIHALFEEDQGGAFDRTLRRKRDRPEVKVGQSITVTKGAFQGFAHTFEGLDSQGRVKALMHLFGRKSRVLYGKDEVAEFVEDE